MTESAGRVEAFSDGVFAIAITLLILEIRVPHGDGGLWAGLLALWPSYIAFLMSFIVILIMWVNHHELLRMVRSVNYPFLFANGLLLLTVTFVANALLWNLLFTTMVRGGLLRREVTAATVDTVRRTYYVGVLVYVLATGLAFVRPALGLVLNASLCVVWIRLGYRSESVASS